MGEKPYGSPVLIIVSGPPGAGKSTLSQRLANSFELPLLQKDMIKETLCDVLECTTLSQSQLYGRASMLLLYQFAEAILKRGQSCIIESTFHPTFSMQDLLKLQQHCPFSRSKSIVKQRYLSLLNESSVAGSQDNVIMDTWSP